MAKLEIEISAITKGLTDGLKKAESQLQGFASQAVNIGKTLSLAVTAPILALGVASIKSASDTEEAFSKFDTVFKGVAKSAQDSFSILRNEYGLSSLQAKSLLGATGDLLTGFGFSQKSALDLATEVNKLAVDLASFTNFAGGAEGASKALTSALLGEREAVKALGISILEEDVKKQVAINTAKGLTFETERQAKAFATLEIAQNQSKNAIGDYARTSDSFANQTRLLQARISDLSSELGTVLLPIATKITKFVTSLVTQFQSLSDETKRSIVIFAGIAAAIGPALLLIGGLIQALPLLGVAFAALTGPIGLAVTAITLGVVAIVTNFDAIRQQVKITLLELIDFSISVVKAIDTLAGVFPGFQAITTGALFALEQLGKKVAESIITDLGIKSVDAVNDFQESINSSVVSTENLNGQVEKLKRNFEQIISLPKLESPFSGGLPTLPTNQAPGISDRQKQTPFFAQLLQDLNENIPTITERLQTFAFNVQDILQNEIALSFQDLGLSIGEALATGGNVIKAIGNSLLRSIGAFLGQLGKQLIAFGTAGLAFGKLSLALTNPLTAIKAAPLAIAAGIALTAAAGAIGSIGRNGIGGGSGVGSSFAESQTFGGTGAFNNPSDLFSNVTFEIQGTKLVGVLQATQDRFAKG
jgi:hypothetical protein